MCAVYFHNTVAPLLSSITVSPCLLHAERMCGIVAGIFAALIDARSEKPAYNATDCYVFTDPQQSAHYQLLSTLSPA